MLHVYPVLCMFFALFTRIRRGDYVTSILERRDNLLKRLPATYIISYLMFGYFYTIYLSYFS